MAEFKKEDVISLVKAKSGYYKTDLRKVFSALEDSIIDILASAELDDPVEIKLFDGFVIQAKREPVRPATDPRTGEHIMAREKIKPNVKIKRTFKEHVEKVAGIIGDNEDDGQTE